MGWSDANLAGADLTRAVIVDIYGKNMNFTDAELQGADMTNSNMPHVDFSGSGLDLTSMVTVRVPLFPPDDWIADHRQRLQRVMNHWGPMLSAQGDKPPPGRSRRRARY